MLEEIDSVASCVHYLSQAHPIQHDNTTYYFALTLASPLVYPCQGLFPPVLFSVQLAAPKRNLFVSWTFFVHSCPLSRFHMNGSKTEIKANVHGLMLWSKRQNHDIGLAQPTSTQLQTSSVSCGVSCILSTNTCKFAHGTPANLIQCPRNLICHVLRGHTACLCTQASS